MKYYGIMLLSMLFVGCGDSGTTAPARDGKGSIDLASYFPAQSMVKIFTSSSRYTAATIEESITVDGQNTIYDVLIRTRGTISFTVSTSNYQVKTSYDDNTITMRNEFNNVISTYRHVDSGERRSEDSSDSYEDYMSYVDIENTQYVSVGQKITKNTNVCTYVGTVKMVSSPSKVFEGDFLKIECKNKTINTVVIDDRYKNNIKVKDVDGEHSGRTSITTEYFQKGIGKIFKETKNFDIIPCKQTTCEEVHDVSYDGRTTLDKIL